MIRCELLDGETVDIRIKGSAADVCAEFFHILKEWSEAMERVTPTCKEVYMWNTLMVALGEDMEDNDLMEVAAATDAGRFYVPKRGDGLPLTLWALLEGGIPYDRRTVD